MSDPAPTAGRDDAAGRSNALAGWLHQRPLFTATVYTIVGVLPLYLTFAQAVTVQQVLGFGPSVYGIVVAVWYLVSAVAAQTLGPMVDRRGPRFGLQTGMALTVLATVIVALSTVHWGLLVVGFVFSGLGNTFGQLAANLVIARLVRVRRQAFSFSAKQSAIPMSAMVSGFLVPLVGGPSTWWVAYLGIGGTAALLWWACPRFAWTPEAPTPGSSRPDGRPRRMTPALLALMVTAACAGGTGNALAAFTTDAAVASGLTQSAGALLLTAGSLVAIVVRVSAGLNADRRGGTGFLEMLSLFGAGLLGLAVLAAGPDTTSVFIPGLLLAFAGTWGWQGVIAFTALRTTTVPAATATGAVWAGVYLGTVLTPIGIGFLLERTSYTWVFVGQGGLMLVAATSLVLSRVLARREGGLSARAT